MTIMLVPSVDTKFFLSKVTRAAPKQRRIPKRNAAQGQPVRHDKADYRLFRAPQITLTVEKQ
jgi:hypothetical protein